MKKFYLLFTLVYFSLNFANAQSVAQTRCDRFGKGVNLSNWLEAYWQTNWPTAGNYGRQFLVDMKAAGIRSVRMPTCFANVTDTLPPYNVDTTNAVFSWVDSVIQWTGELDMNLIIDNHHKWNFTDSTWRGLIPRMGHLWAVLAQRYAHLNPEHYFFEIVNEPYDIPNDSLNILNTAVIDSIRKFAPYHSIVVSPTSYSGGVAYITYQPLADTNLIYTFHSYDPIQFTHQGFTWHTPYYNTGTIYPGSGFDFLVTVAWEPTILWRDSFHLPVFMGEFGVGRYADSISRCNWIDTVGSKIDQYHMSAFNWDVKYDFPLYRSSVTTRDSVYPCFMQFLHLYEDSLSGIVNVPEPVSVQMYPNPSTSIFYCEGDFGVEMSVAVCDNTGRIIYHSNFTGKTAVNTGQWARGLYFVKFETTKGVAVKKLVLE